MASVTRIPLFGVFAASLGCRIKSGRNVLEDTEVGVLLVYPTDAVTGLDPVTQECRTRI